MSETLHKRKNNREPNEIIEYEDYAEVILYSKNIECARVKISLDKIEIAKQYKWCLYSRNRSCYAMTTINNNTAKMHSVLFDVPEGMIIDHINRDGLDNRNENIRFCTSQENSRNVGIKPTNKSGHIGVFWNPLAGKWRAMIKVNYKNISLGQYHDINDAIAARKAAEAQYFGNYAPQDVE